MLVILYSSLWSVIAKVFLFFVYSSDDDFEEVEFGSGSEPEVKKMLDMLIPKHKIINIQFFLFEELISFYYFTLANCR